MKYFLLVIFLVFVLATAVYADDKEDLIAEFNKLSEHVAKGRQSIAEIEARLIEIQGALKYIISKEKKALVKEEEEAKAKSLQKQEDEGDIEIKKEK